jgi:3(or 17)beta-hydroxysteroid dehydrogenase
MMCGERGFMRKLQDKICVVTGGARGIGLAIASLFHQQGAAVIITDIDEDAGTRAAEALGCRFIGMDVSCEADWLRLGEAVPRCDVVVNNAGVTGFEHGPVAHDPEHATLADWNQVHRVNLDGVFLGCRYAIGAMKARGDGSIINMSSRSGIVGIPAAAAYASSKAAVRNHTKSVALYCAQQGWRIRCNSIHPAAILTPMWEAMLGDGPDRAERMAALVADTPLKRFGTVEEVAAMALMLAEDGSAYVTGSEFHVDGGLLAGSAASPSG